MNTATPTLAELQKESRMGAMGTESTREVRQIDLSDFDRRFDEIGTQLWNAAVDVGFFQRTTTASRRPTWTRPCHVAALLRPARQREGAMAAPQGRQLGWESKAQVRPSTRTPDQKESYQITRPHMEGLWPTEAELPAFQGTMLGFEAKCWRVAMQVLSCFAVRLGFPREFFAGAHDPSRETYQSTLRLLHYYAIPPELQGSLELWRAGAHTDFDCLTLLFQRQGQGGLQVLPGKEMESQAWTPVPPDEKAITCNIGDMLMRWSDDQLPSNFHRVKNPQPGEDMGARYTIAFFAQANRDAMIETPSGKYPPMNRGRIPQAARERELRQSC